VEIKSDQSTAVSHALQPYQTNANEHGSEVGPVFDDYTQPGAIYYLDSKTKRVVGVLLVNADEETEKIISARYLLQSSKRRFEKLEQLKTQITF